MGQRPRVISVETTFVAGDRESCTGNVSTYGDDWEEKARAEANIIAAGLGGEVIEEPVRDQRESGGLVYISLLQLAIVVVDGNGNKDVRARLYAGEVKVKQQVNNDYSTQ